MMDVDELVNALRRAQYTQVGLNDHHEIFADVSQIPALITQQLYTWEHSKHPGANVPHLKDCPDLTREDLICCVK